MAASGGVVSRSACQGLLQAVARPRTRSRLLLRTSRCISSGVQVRRVRTSSLRPEDVKKRDRWLLEEFPKPFKTIDQKSIVACKEPVRLVGSKIECLCSWNEASGPRQAIYVPGDASRPKEESLSPSGLAAGASLAPADENRLWGYCNPGRAPRGRGWDDALAALFATSPELNLDGVDVMVGDEVLIYLLMVAQNGKAPFFGRPIFYPRGQVLNMQLIGDTLAIRLRVRREDEEHIILVPTSMPRNWEYYKAATEPVPEVEDSSIHRQLLRYQIGPLSFLVRIKVNGTVQEMPKPTAASEAPQARNVHGIDVIKAGQGVNPALAFQASAGSVVRQGQTLSNIKRLRALTVRTWLAGQTRRGIVDAVPPSQDREPGGLTVIDMADLVRHYEEQNEEGLRRLVGLLKALKAAVRAHGAPCIGVYFPPIGTADTRLEENHAIHVYGADPDEPPVLLDWHKEQFWSQHKRHEKNDWSFRKVPNKKMQPRRKTTKGQSQSQEKVNDEHVHTSRRETTKGQSQPQEKVNDEHVQAPKGFIRKWAQRLGL